MSLPNFMCIGAAKSGTTSLYDILRQHSEIYLPSFKEPHFFDIPSVYNNGLDWYKEMYFSKVKEECCIGDFTPTYFFEKQAAKRIYDNLGEHVKFIIILRDPVDRAYSHYLHSKRDLHEDLTFIEALAKESERMSQGDYLSRLRFSYVLQGMYFHMLEEYLKFFKKENFLILSFEDEFIAKREETINRIFSFLELDHQFLNININSNRASQPRFRFIKKIMKDHGVIRNIIKQLVPSLITRQIIKNTIQKLNLKPYSPLPLSIENKKNIFDKYFREDIFKLEKLIGKKMNWDK